MSEILANKSLSSLGANRSVADYGPSTGRFEEPSGELDVIQEASIRSLEAIDSDTSRPEETCVRPQMKAEALLVMAGVKPAALADFYGQPHTQGEPPKPTETSADAYADLLNSCGLEVYILEETRDAKPDPRFPDEKRLYELTTVYAAKDLQALDELYTASVKHDRRGVGLALGYPLSSVNAFIEGQTQEISSFIDLDPTVAAFCPFMLSKDNYREELALVSRWVETVQKLSPAIFTAVLQGTRGAITPNS